MRVSGIPKGGRKQSGEASLDSNSKHEQRQKRSEKRGGEEPNLEAGGSRIDKEKNLFFPLARSTSSAPTVRHSYRVYLLLVGGHEPRRRFFGSCKKEGKNLVARMRMQARRGETGTRAPALVAPCAVASASCRRLLCKILDSSWFASKEIQRQASK